MDSFEEEINRQIKLTNETFDREDEVKKTIILLNSAIAKLNSLYAQAGKGPVNVENYVLKHIISQRQLNELHENFITSQCQRQTSNGGGANVSGASSGNPRDKTKKNFIKGRFLHFRVKPYRTINSNEFEGVSLE